MTFLFRKFMKTAPVVNPHSVENVKQTLLNDQEILNSQRLDLVKTLW